MIEAAMLELMQRILYEACLKGHTTLIVCDCAKTQTPIMLASQGRIYFRKPQVSALLNLRADVVYIQLGLPQSIQDAVHSHVGVRAKIEYFDPFSGELT